MAGLATSSKRVRRLSQMVDAIGENEELSVEQLTDMFSSSPATIRRDLTLLSEQHLVQRTHGGARPLGSAREVPVLFRDSRFRDSKRLIARAAVDLIPAARMAIAISGGTTTAEVARLLAERSQLSVVTNSVSIASLLAPFQQLRILLTGGLLRPQSLELVGALAENTFNSVNIGIAILGADGVSAAEGVTTHDETEARTNHAMVDRAPRTIVVADGSKVGQVAMARMADITEVAVLITDSSADAQALESIRIAGVEVIVVDAP